MKKNLSGYQKNSLRLSLTSHRSLNLLKKTPLKADPLGNNCYKVRLAIESKGKGKSGGARVITRFKVVHNTVYLLTIFDKGERENVPDKELSELLKFID